MAVSPTNQIIHGYYTDEIGTTLERGGILKSLLKTGDPCPCCGQPIRSTDPDVLRLLTLIRDNRVMPTVEQIQEIVRRGEREKP